MTDLKYFYAKLSCPNSDDGQVFLNLFNSLKKNDFFEFTLNNIPNKLEEASINDVILINIGGDSSNKKKYFNKNVEFQNYINGLHSIGFIKEINVNKKEVIVNIIGLKEIVTKEDLYFFPQFINNLGASTKGTPNQAGLYDLEESIAVSLFDYLKKRDILSPEFILPENLRINNNLYSVALEDYNKNFKEKELTQKIFQKYTGVKENDSKLSDKKLLISEFVNWFNLEENYKSSYKGIVNEENLLFWDRVYFNSEIFNITGENKKTIYQKISSKINNLNDSNWDDFNFSSSKGAPKAVLGEKNYLKFLRLYLDVKWKPSKNEIKYFNVSLFNNACEKAGLKYDSNFITRFVSSLLTKPFVILTGLSGSGKTKLAQAFAQWISKSQEQYKIIPVGADWTNREPLLGYPNGLEPNLYVMPDSGVLKLMLDALKDESKPYFLILDEMNLSHVERYFADFLSIMESGEKLKLYTGEKRYSKDFKDEILDHKFLIPQEIEWPNNLFIIGTVNIDETTYMFSPKVLDRANVIEFRITTNEMKKFFTQREELNMKRLFIEENKENGGIGQNMGSSFLVEAQKKTISKIAPFESENNILNNFFSELQKVGAEFGYRSAIEIELLITKLGNVGLLDDEGQPLNDNKKIDIAIMQKLLPKLHGSRKKLVNPLEILAGFCLERKIASPELAEQLKTKSTYEQFIFEKRDSRIWEIKYTISFEKIERMLKNVIENGFTSYAEA